MLKINHHSIVSLSTIVSLILLTGCSLKPLDPVPTQTYLLTPAIPTVASKPGSLTLLVEMPKAPSAFDSTQIAYINKPYQLSYFSYSHWADSPAQLLHPLLVQALQNTGHFKAVIRTPGAVQYDMALNIYVLQLQQVFLQKPSVVQLNVRSQLVNNKSHQVIATQQFTIDEPALQDTPYGGVEAANKAVGKLLQQITQFCLANTQQNNR